jgi:hypothetical protein
MSKVKLELNKKNITEKTEYSKKVITQMTDNVNFISPNPSLISVSTATTNASVASGEVETARKTVQEKMSILNQQEGILDGFLTQLGAYVDNVSNGDEAIILSAGMDVQKDRTAARLPDKITSVNATTGNNAGEIDLSWDKASNTKSYVVETALNGVNPLEWKHALVSTKSKAEITGLVTGTGYNIRIAAVGSAGQGPWSDPVVKVAP